MPEPTRCIHHSVTTWSWFVSDASREEAGEEGVKKALALLMEAVPGSVDSA
jgi:hypothetical protein